MSFISITIDLIDIKEDHKMMTKTIIISKDDFSKLKHNYFWMKTKKTYQYTKQHNFIKLKLSFTPNNRFNNLLDSYNLGI